MEEFYFVEVRNGLPKLLLGSDPRLKAKEDAQTVCDVAPSGAGEIVWKGLAGSSLVHCKNGKLNSDGGARMG